MLKDFKLVPTKTSVLLSLIIGLGGILFSCLVNAEAEKPFAELLYGKLLPDNGSQTFGRAIPLLALDKNGSYMMVGNFEKLLLDFRNRPSVMPSSNITAEEAKEYDEAAKETVGIVRFAIEGQQKLIKIVKYTYDAKFDISIVVTNTDDVFGLSRIANSHSVANLTCYGAMKLIYPIKIKKSDFLPTPTILALEEAEVESIPSNARNVPPHLTDLFDPFHVCIVADEDNAIIGLVRNLYQKVELGPLYNSIQLVYQPVGEAFPYAQGLAASEKNFSEYPEVVK